MNTLYFQINNAEPKEFAKVEEGKLFDISFKDFPTQEELDKLTNHSLLLFTDKENNSFKIFSKPS